LPDDSGKKKFPIADAAQIRVPHFSNKKTGSQADPVFRGDWRRCKRR
jgi:hypothetical protein